MYLKLDRLGGDLFGLKRAVLELGCGVGDRVGLRSADGFFETFAVLSLDTGREGELEIASGDTAGARILWEGIRVRAFPVVGKR
jgi:hypothetical protein